MRTSQNVGAYFYCYYCYYCYRLSLSAHMGEHLATQKGGNWSIISSPPLKVKELKSERVKE